MKKILFTIIVLFWLLQTAFSYEWYNPDYFFYKKNESIYYINRLKPTIFHRVFQELNWLWDNSFSWDNTYFLKTNIKEIRNINNTETFLIKDLSHFSELNYKNIWFYDNFVLFINFVFKYLLIFIWVYLLNFLSIFKSNNKIVLWFYIFISYLIITITFLFLKFLFWTNLFYMSILLLLINILFLKFRNIKTIKISLLFIFSISYILSLFFISIDKSYLSHLIFIIPAIVYLINKIIHFKNRKKRL